MAFKQKGSLNPHGAPVLRREILKNSTTVVVMDSHKLVSGFAEAGTAGALVFGHVVAHSTRQGLGVDSTGAAGAALGSYVGSFATASDNQTVAKVKGEYDISKYSLYTVTPDATIGTTTGSNLSGYKTDIASATATDEDTATTSTAQYTLWGVDPDNSANQIASIYESQVFGV
jgi:hypothetical protein